MSPPDSTAPAAVVDAHFHLWSMEGGRYGWVGDWQRSGRPLPSRYLPPDHAAAFGSRRLAGGVHVEADRDNARPWLETEWLAGLAPGIGFPFAIVAHADLTREDLPQVLERHVAAGPVRGIRMRLAPSPRELAGRRAEDTLLGDARFREGFARLAEHGLSFEMQATANLLPAVAEFAASRTDVPIVLSHFAFPFDRSAAGLAEWRRGLEAVADRAHVHLKLSGLRMLDPAMPDGVVAALVEIAAEVLGAGRLMFGSNFPVETVACAPERALDPLIGAIEALGPAASRQILAANARRFYRLPEA